MSKNKNKDRYQIDGCTGCQVCVSIAPGAFSLGSDGLAKAKDGMQIKKSLKKQQENVQLMQSSLIKQ